MIRAALISALIGAALGVVGTARWLPPRTVMVTAPGHERVRVVYRTLVRERVVTRPDGTVIRSTEHTDTDARTTDTPIAAPTPEAPRWHAGALFVLAPGALGDPAVGVSLSRQIAGPLSVGLTATVPARHPATVPTIAITAGFGF